MIMPAGMAGAYRHRPLSVGSAFAIMEGYTRQYFAQRRRGRPRDAAKPRALPRATRRRHHASMHWRHGRELYVTGRLPLVFPQTGAHFGAV